MAATCAACIISATRASENKAAAALKIISPTSGFSDDFHTPARKRYSYRSQFEDTANHDH